MFKFSPTDRTDILILITTAGLFVLALLYTGAAAVAHHGLDTLGEISVGCWGIGLLLVIYGLLWGRQHAKLIYLLAVLASFAGIIPAQFQPWP